MRSSAAKNEPLKFTSGGTIETLARRGNAVPLGAAGICCAVNTEVVSCSVNKMLSRSTTRHEKDVRDDFQSDDIPRIAMWRGPFPGATSICP